MRRLIMARRLVVVFDLSRHGADMADMSGAGDGMVKMHDGFALSRVALSWYTSYVSVRLVS